jgi:hypothetical protein
LCKILESIIRDNILVHFFKNNLFSDEQYGFLKGRSTVLQLLKLLDEWTEYLEGGGQIDVVYTDLEKAFDKVPHFLLLKKLKSYKIHEDIIDWITAFLIDRTQRVRIGNSFSELVKVISGIPQGSVLVHYFLLFMLMI